MHTYQPITLLKNEHTIGISASTILKHFIYLVICQKKHYLCEDDFKSQLSGFITPVAHIMGV